MKPLALLAALPLAGCVADTAGGPPPESACRGAYAERLGLPMSMIEIGGRSAGPNGGAVYGMRTVDGVSDATCRLGAGGAVLGIDPGS